MAEYNIHMDEAVQLYGADNVINAVDSPRMVCSTPARREVSRGEPTFSTSLSAIGDDLHHHTRCQCSR